MTAPTEADAKDVAQVPPCSGSPQRAASESRVLAIVCRLGVRELNRVCRKSSSSVTLAVSTDDQEQPGRRLLATLSQCPRRRRHKPFHGQVMAGTAKTGHDATHEGQQRDAP